MSWIEELRQMRHQVNLARFRYLLGTGENNTGLGRTAWILYGLVRSLQPEVAVEIGTARGWSACHIGLALRENIKGRLYAIDPHSDTAWNDVGSRGESSLPALRQKLRRMRLDDYVEIVRMESRAAAVGWKKPIDLLFIDGDHSYAGVKADWELFSPHLSRFGVAVFHDTTWQYHRGDPFYREDMGVPRFVEELRLAGHPVVTIDRDCGISLVQRPSGGIPLMPSD